MSAHAHVKDAGLRPGPAPLLRVALPRLERQRRAEQDRAGQPAAALARDHSRSSDLGYQVYDFGGIPLDSADQEKNDIARFKLEFGGELLIEYSGVLPMNVRGQGARPARGTAGMRSRRLWEVTDDRATATAGPAARPRWRTAARSGPVLKLAGGLAERGYPVDLVLTRAEGPFLAEVSPDDPGRRPSALRA